MGNKYIWHIYVNEHLPDLSASSLRPLWPLSVQIACWLIYWLTHTRNAHLQVGCLSISDIWKEKNLHPTCGSNTSLWPCLMMHFNSWAAHIQHVMIFNSNNLHSQPICKINMKTRSTLNALCIFTTCVNFLYLLTEPNKKQINPKISGEFSCWV